MINCCGLISLRGITTGCPIHHEVLPRSQWIALFHRAGSSHERNLIGTRVSFPKKLHRVSPIVRTSQYQFSTLEKTKLCYHPALSSGLRKAFGKLFVIIARRRFWVAAHNGLPRSILSLSAFAPQGF